MLFKLFQLFIQSFPDEPEFSSAVFYAICDFVESLTGPKELEAFFDLARVLPADRTVIQTCLTLLSSPTIAPSRLLEKSIQYLGEHFHDSQTDYIVRFIYRLLRSNAVNNFLYQTVLDLIQTLHGRLGRTKLWISAMQHAVVVAWNAKPADVDPVKTFFILKIADVIGTDASFTGWATFVARVLRHFRAQRPFPIDFKIPEGELDMGLIRSLAKSAPAPPETRPVGRRGTVSGPSRPAIEAPVRPRRTRRASLPQKGPPAILEEIARVPLMSEEDEGAHTQDSPRQIGKSRSKRRGISKRKTCSVY
jgi:hypothetical protein